MRKNTPRKLIGTGAKLLIAVCVLLFLGLQSLNFFQFTFPPDQWYYSYLGFALTSGGVIGYLLVFKNDADTQLKKTISVIMLIICVGGELLTAGFGMQVETFANGGFTLTQDDFKFMVIVVQILGLAHGLAMLLYFAGDQIFELFQDEDKDGIPNLFDRDYLPRSPRPGTLPRPYQPNPMSVPESRMYPMDETQPVPHENPTREPRRPR